MTWTTERSSSFLSTISLRVWRNEFSPISNGRTEEYCCRVTGKPEVGWSTDENRPMHVSRSVNLKLRVGDWAFVDELREIAGRKPVCTGTDRGLLRSVLGPWSPVPKCEAPEAPISMEEHISMTPAKPESSASKIFRDSGITLVFKYHV